ncbi:MAG: hypothetical protein HY293_15280 [Planctomycetes bacterium]|nr:hypothetical protein [Planctomycetota bacterium]
MEVHAVVRSVLDYWFWMAIPALICFIPVGLIRQAERSSPEAAAQDPHFADPWFRRAIRILVPLLLVCSWLSLLIQMVGPWDRLGERTEVWQELDERGAVKLSEDEFEGYMIRRKVLHRRTVAMTHLAMNVLGICVLLRLKKRNPGKVADFA